MARKKQLIFPLVLTGQSERVAIETVARHLRGSQSEVLRRMVEVVLEAVNSKSPSAAQTWLLDEIDVRVRQTWER